MTELLLREASFEEIGGHSSFSQSPFWGSFKAVFGQIPKPFLINDIFPLLVMLRPIPGGMFLAYIPHGPGNMDLFPEKIFPSGPEDFLISLGEKLREYLPKQTVFIRFEPPWGMNTAAKAPLEKPEFNNHPPSTVLLHIGAEEDEILGGMKSKTRYNIRLAGRKGVVVRMGTVADLPRWYDIYRETAERDKITLHSYSYYERLFQLAEEAESAGVKGELADFPRIRLLLAEVEGTAEAGIINLMYHRRATYLYGASTDRKRNYMPAYALQWEGIRLARKEGCLEYDLFGIPSTDSPDHPMHGLYRFKSGFGGTIIHRPGCLDYPLRRGLYGLYRAAERIRNFYFRSFKKR